MPARARRSFAVPPAWSLSYGSLPTSSGALPLSRPATKGSGTGTTEGCNKIALLVATYTVGRNVRTPEQVVDALFENRKRQHRKGAGDRLRPRESSQASQSSHRFWRTNAAHQR